MRSVVTAVMVIISVLVASGCAGSGAKESMPQTGSVSPDVGVVRTEPRITRPVVLAIRPKGMRGLDPSQGARFLSSTRLAIPGVVGSSNCPSVPTRLIIENRHAIRLDLAVGSWSRTAAGSRLQVPRSGGICLADLHPVPVVIAISPKQIDVHHRLKVSLYYPKFAIRTYRHPVVLSVPPL